MKKVFMQGLKYVISILIILVIIGPLLVVLFTSFKTKEHMVTVSPLLLPDFSEITLENYRDVFSSKYLLSAFKNTAFIVLVSLFFNIIFGSITAYALERFHFKLKRIIVALFFLGMMIPTFVMEISRFKVIGSLGLYNTLGAPIIIYIASDLMQLYIYRQFIKGIPIELDESALLDGCGYYRIFSKIIFPLLAPATATLVIIKSVNIINDMYIPYLYMPSTRLKTLSTFLMSYASAQQGSWQILAAAIVVVMIPTLSIYIFFQKYIFEGVSAGAVKS
ncbi:carbohydrate ABC transporter permease [Mediterraneibacter agrestimuris]|uniref:carbohydrate ABC transporter permease n=1 Tax=Mediterraneibacter agrestimuris TaxID=2941333 RepID=UPI0020408F74|nr:carbohydrate ABC transporter permease [Mediterraneibacter agrestimuris]